MKTTLAQILAILPVAQIETDNDGQVIIYTGLSKSSFEKLTPDKIRSRTIVVLSDGETYSNIDGCTILRLTNQGIDKLEEAGRPQDIPEGCITKRIDL